MQDLTDEQTAALRLEGTRCCLIAGPGSGKTHTLTARIVRDELHTDPAGMVVVTFTNAAAGELRERLTRKGMDPRTFRHIGTLHSWAARSMKSLGDFRHIASDKQIAEACMAAKRTLGAMARNLSGAEIWRCAVEPPRYGSARQVGLAVRNWLVRNGLTHHDLILADFESEITAGRVEAPARIYVDEYQDSAPVDARIYDAMHALGASLYFIGDPRQAIYGFRGATPDNLARAWREADAKGQLTACFRSRATICRLVTAIATRMPAGDFDPTVQALTEEPGTVDLHPYQSEQDEQVAAAAWAGEQRDAGRSAAILVRYNSQAKALAALLRSRGIKTTCSADLPEQPGKQTLAEATAMLLALRTVPATPDGWRNQMISLGITMANQDALLPRLSAISTPDDLISLGADSEAGAALLGLGIAVATIHAAKGLEWDAVLFYGADNQAFPEESEEAGRLAFVACSRARDHLTISRSESRLQVESGKTLTGLYLTRWI